MNDFHVVIDNDNKIEIKSDKAKPSLDEAESQKSNYYQQDIDAKHEFLRDFEPSQFREWNSNRTEPQMVRSQSSYFTKIHHDPKPENDYSQHHQHKNVMPSFSKIPDYLTRKFFSDDYDNEDYHYETVNTKPNKPLVVPVGSRVHTITYKDYSKPDSNEVVSKYYDKYEPKIIELPSSKPVLPIVINFRTRSSPIIATQNSYKSPSSVPKVQYFQTNEPPHYRTHIVHKPIIQDLREIIVPYRFLIQEISPVEEYKETYVPVNKNYYSRKHNSNYITKLPVFMTDYGNMAGNNLVPFYAATNTKTSHGFQYTDSVHKNPYMDIPVSMPYRVKDLYTKTLPYEGEHRYSSSNRYNKYN